MLDLSARLIVISGMLRSSYVKGYPKRPIISLLTCRIFFLPNQEINILKTCQPDGLLESLDVYSLFTSVPVEETIEIICNSLKVLSSERWHRYGITAWTNINFVGFYIGI